MKKSTLIAFAVSAAVLASSTLCAKEYHVSIERGDDEAPGSAKKPLQTISAAAAKAQPGDIVTVHAGTYREEINPPRGGVSDKKRIVYQAAEGEEVAIKGSERFTGWEKVQNDTWKVSIPNSVFGDFNPYTNLIQGDWFKAKGRRHHTGAVYLDGHWLSEAKRLADVLEPATKDPLWFASQGGARMEAAQFAKQDGIRSTAAEGSEKGGTCIGWISDGDWALYEGLDFGKGTEALEIRAAFDTTGGIIEIRLDGPEGELLGSVEIPNTGGWQSWSTFEAPISPSDGSRAVALVFREPEEDASDEHLLNVAWLECKSADNEEDEETNTTIWAQFPDVNPNDAKVEINVRQTVFYPRKPGVDYITVRGFRMMHAATPWAPPTAEQIGLIGTHWSKGWIIADNDIGYSTCTGVTLGKYGDEWDNRAQSAEGYVGTIKRALENGWSKENIGSHIVRDNTIHHCEQAGLVGSMGAVFSTIAGNEVHDIHMREFFGGAEIAGIKFHGAIDTVIRGNHIYRCFGYGGIWLDWMTQGTQVSRNLMHDNKKQDLHLEVNHGPYMIDNNIFLSARFAWERSQGGAFANNLAAGKIRTHPEGRSTPYHKPHSTEMAGLRNIKGGDNRFRNNIFVGPGKSSGEYGLSMYNGAALPVYAGGNVYLHGAQPYKEGEGYIEDTDFNPGIKLIEKDDGFYLEMKIDKDDWQAQKREIVTTDLLGKAQIPDQTYTHPNGSPYRIDTDYFGKKRDEDNPFPGPFAAPKNDGKQGLKVWPVSQSR